MEYSDKAIRPLVLIMPKMSGLRHLKLKIKKVYWCISV